MYAIVEIGGTQCKVEKDKVLRVPKIDEKEGKSIEFTDVLLIVDKAAVQIGTPFVKDAVIKATILAQGRDRKVMVFKKKRRKNYKVKKGHRQDFTELRIDSIGTGKAGSGKTAAEKPAAKKAESEPAAKKPAPKTAPKTPAAKKPAAAKAPATASKKTAAKDTASAEPKPAAKKPAAKAAPKKSAKTVEKKKED